MTWVQGLKAGSHNSDPFEEPQGQMKVGFHTWGPRVAISYALGSLAVGGGAWVEIGLCDSGLRYPKSGQDAWDECRESTA